jgi:hypothetical protein
MKIIEKTTSLEPKKRDKIKWSHFFLYDIILLDHIHLCQYLLGMKMQNHSLLFHRFRFRIQMGNLIKKVETKILKILSHKFLSVFFKAYLRSMKSES